MFPGHVLFKGAAGSLLDLGQHMLMMISIEAPPQMSPGVSGQILSAAQDLPRQLVNKSQPLFVRPRLAEPGDRMAHRLWGDHAADDGRQNLQVRDALHKDLQAARPVVELSPGIRHEFRVGLDATARKDQQGASLLEVANGFTDDLHSSHGVAFVGCKNGVLPDMRHVLQKRNISNNRLVVRAIHVGCDDEQNR